MRGRVLIATAGVAAAVAGAGVALGDDGGGSSLPSNARWRTVFRPATGIEGLTADARGNLYTAARGSDSCPVYRVAAGGGTAAVVGTIPAPCGPAG